MAASSTHRPVITISAGDPGGIGPEVVVKALADPDLRRRAHVRIHASEAALRDAADRASIAPCWLTTSAADAAVTLDSMRAIDVIVVDHGPGVSAGAYPAAPSAESGELSFRCVEQAIAEAARPPGDRLRCDAIVTAPISKQAWAMAGHGEFPGHTELLAARFAAPRTAMFFHAPARDPVPAFGVVLVTAHVPLARVPALLTPERVLECVRLGRDACRRLGVPSPRVGVAGLNPHAGEGGLLGDEDARIIGPAVGAAVREGIDARGPLPGDTIFRSLVAGRLDLVVAMYHDQGLIPVKLVAGERAVNVTLGLPTVRTSPDHGTAFDIAGRNVADPRSMASAIALAIDLAAPGRCEPASPSNVPSAG